MLSAVIRWESSYPAMLLLETTGTPGIPSSQSSRHFVFSDLSEDQTISFPFLTYKNTGLAYNGSLIPDYPVPPI